MVITGVRVVRAYTGFIETLLKHLPLLPASGHCSQHFPGWHWQGWEAPLASSRGHGSLQGSDPSRRRWVVRSCAWQVPSTQSTYQALPTEKKNFSKVIRGFAKGVGRKGFLESWFVNRKKSEQIGTNRGIPENKERKSEHVGRKRGNRNKSGWPPSADPRLGAPNFLQFGGTGELRR